MNERDEITQNLRDAGCSESCIRRFFDLSDSGESAKAKRILERHRKGLLNELHESQKKIDCLDYLSWYIKRKNVSANTIAAGVPARAVKTIKSGLQENEKDEVQA